MVKALYTKTGLFLYLVKNNEKKDIDNQGKNIVYLNEVAISKSNNENTDNKDKNRSV